MRDSYTFILLFLLVVIYWGIVAPHFTGFFIGIAITWGFYFLGIGISKLMDYAKKPMKD